MVTHLRRTADVLLRLLFPPRCVHCERIGVSLCSDCAGDIVRFATPRCPRCDGPRTWRHHCDVPRTLTKLRTIGPHTGVLRSAVHALKYKGRHDVARPVALLLARRWSDVDLDVAGLVPVPLGRRRRRERGYNQAAVLARELGRILTLPVHTDVLRRVRETRPQVKLTGDERLHNVADAFAAASTARDCAWLLIDDVCTTGATLGACAEALHRAGATDVYATTVTRTSDESPLLYQQDST